MKRLLAVLLSASSCVETEYIGDPPGSLSLRVVPAQSYVLLDSMTVFSGELEQGAPVAVRWESADGSIATVDQTGTATGRADGQVFIRALLEGVASDSALLNVLSDTSGIAVITVSPEDTVLRTGDSIRAVAAARSYHGQLLDGLDFAWASSDTAVAVVTPEGTLTARSPGFSLVRASVGPFQSAPAILRVTGASRTGSFMGYSGTPVSGTARLDAADGTVALSFSEDFQCEPGPSLYVYLSHSGAITASSLEIAPLKSVAGAQAYTIPDGVGPGDYGFVVIHCKPYNHTFGYAQLD